MEWYMKAGSAEEIPLYDCRANGKSYEQLEAMGTANASIGIAFIVYGVIAEAAYIMPMWIMFGKEFQRFSCYKIMITLGIYDMLALMVNSILSGYLWIVGGWYCTHPDLIFVSGSLGLGLWTGACMTCLILVLNRLLDLWNANVNEKIFSGCKTYFILMIPFFYSVYFALFTPPLLFNSTKTAWFFDPFIIENESDKFYNMPHTANNLLIVVATTMLYAVLCYVLVHKYSLGQMGKITWNQKSIILQSTAICMANLIAALIYVYMQFYPTSEWAVLLGHISWQAGHGIPAFVYLFMNRTIRHEVKEKLLAFFRIFRASMNIHSSKTTITPFHNCNVL